MEQSSKNNSTSVLICQVPPLEREQQFVSLRYETDEYETYPYTLWRGDRMLRELATGGISALVVGASGLGRSVAVCMADYECHNDGSLGSDGRVKVFAGMSGEELELEICPEYYRRKKPLKEEWQWQKHIKTKGDSSSLSCGICPRHCPLSGVGHPGTFEGLFLLVASKVKGQCALRLELGIRKLIDDGVPVIIDVNDAKTVIPIASSLLRSRIPVVLVASPQVARQLTSDPDIRALPVLQFPVMPDDTIREIARVRGCNDDRIVEMAQGSPRRLVLRVATVSGVEQIEPSRVEAISMGKALQLERPKKTVDEMVEDYCLANAGMLIKPKEVSEWLYQEYNQVVSPEQVGRSLNRLGYEGKHTMSGTVYSL